MRRVYFYLLTWLLVICMSSLGVAAPASVDGPHERSVISDKLGLVEEVYKGDPAKPTIYYIQDAHSIYSAQ